MSSDRMGAHSKTPRAETGEGFSGSGTPALSGGDQDRRGDAGGVHHLGAARGDPAGARRSGAGFQMPAQHHPGAMDAGAYGADGAVHRVGDLLIGTLLNVAEQDRSAVVL